MKYIPVILLVFLTVFTTQAQTYEIGGVIGGVNYIGDVGNTAYINPNGLAFGGILKWNRSPRHSYRATLLFASFDGDDAKSGEARREQRGYFFNNNILEASLGLEYTFWEYNVHSGKVISTPYLYTGLTVFSYDNLYKDISTNQINKDGNSVSFAIPMVIGYKMKLGHFVSVAAEIGARYTFTDNLDGSNPKVEGGNNEQYQFGNINNNDWYVFSGLTMTFAFGRKPCNATF